MYGFRFVNVWMKYRNWRLDECVREESFSVVRIGMECNDCNRDSISMMFVMNRSVLEWEKCEWGCLDSMIRIEMWIWMKYERMKESCVLKKVWEDMYNLNYRFW